MIERGAIGLGMMLLVVPMSFIGASAGGRFVERDEPRHIVIDSNDEYVGDEQPHEIEGSSGNHLVRRLFWTLTTITGAPAAIAYLHAWWTGQDEAYIRFQRALLFNTWEALKGIPEGIVASAAEIPALASSIYQDPSLLLQMAEAMIAQTLEQGHAFATIEDDEEAARIASSTVADIWFGKLLTAAGIGTRAALKSRWAARAARTVERITHPKPKLKLATAGFCFVAGTLVHTPEGARAIEDVGVGGRVVTTNGDANHRTEVDASWRRVELVMRDARSADGRIRIAMLRSPKWIKEARAKVGGELEVAFDEMGVRGHARVVGIGSAVPIVASAGRVVLATIESKSSDVRTLRFVETSEMLEPTAGHRLYSLDRNAFVAVRDLHVGEHLRTRHGALTIASITRKPGTHTVYNLEVEHEHEYFVSRSAVLSHNDTVASCAAPNPWGRVHSARPAVAEDIWSEAVRDRTISIFKERFAQVFAASGHNPRQFARTIHVDHRTVRDYLDDDYRRLPKTRTLLGLSHNLRIDPDWLLGLRDGSSAQLQATALGKILSEAGLRTNALAAFKPRFTALAIRANLSNADFARRLGRTSNLTSDHTIGTRDALPSVETLIVLRKIENAPIAWLFGYSDNAPAGVTKRMLRDARRAVAQEGHRGRRVPTVDQSALTQLRVEIHPKLQERLVKLRGDASVRAFAQDVGIPAATLGNAARNPQRLLSTEHLLTAANYAHASPAWLLGESKTWMLGTRSRAWQQAGTPLPPPELFRERLAEVFQRSKLSQQAFADKVGIKPITLRNYLSTTNEWRPAVEVVVAICRAERVRLDWLLGLVDD